MGGAIKNKEMKEKKCEILVIAVDEIQHDIPSCIKLEVFPSISRFDFVIRFYSFKKKKLTT